MSNEITVAEASWGELTSRSNEELKAELVQAMEITVASLGRMAAIVRELERRGVDLGELRLGLVGYLRQIAYGRLSAKAVVRFAERPMLLRAVSELPLEDQDRLAAGQPVQLAVFQNESVTHRLVDPLDLAPDQVRRVFWRGAIRSVAQQVPLLEERRQHPAQGRRPRRGRVRPDPQRGGLVVNRTFVPAAEIVAALAGLSEANQEAEEAGAEEESANLMLKVTESQRRRLKIYAAETGKSISDLLRDALRAAGLI